MAVPKYWRQIPELYHLEGSICLGCERKSYPAREVCPDCHSTKKDPYRFKGKGTIVTSTVIRTPDADPEGESIEIASRHIPYVMAIVQLEEGPRMTSQIVDVNPSEPLIGREVETVFRRIIEKGSRGVIQYGSKFRLVG